MSDHDITPLPTGSNGPENASSQSPQDTSSQHIDNDVDRADQGTGWRRDPFSSLNDLELAMDRMFGRRWRFFRPLQRLGEGNSDWDPQLDVYDDGNDFVIKAELPGVNKDDIDISLDHGYLTLSGHRHAEHEVREEHAYRMERSFGSFSRRIPMPKGVTEDNVSATFADGVLTIRAPKPRHESHTGKKIPVT